jgi:hypothetical protein
MRKTCTLILSMAVALTSRAQMMANVKNNNYTSFFSITNLSAEDIQFEVDGQTYVDCGPSLNIRGLPPGTHQLVLFSGKKGVGMMGSMKRVVIFNKPVNVKPQFYVDVIINRFGRVMVDEQSISGTQYQDGQMTWRNPGMLNMPAGSNQPGNNYNNQQGNYNNQQGNYNNQQQGNYNNQQGNYNNNQGGNWSGQGNYNNAPRPMPDNTFNSFIETVRRESFDDSRMAIAKAGIDQNFFTSNQAKALLSVLSFEASKLEIGKYMYGKTTDPKNYFVVYNVFTFSKSKEELAEYVRTYH